MYMYLHYIMAYYCIRLYGVMLYNIMEASGRKGLIAVSNHT